MDVVTADLSYLALAEAVPQLEGRVAIASDADLFALVKPQFELGLVAPPAEEPALERAARHAAAGIERTGWRVLGVVRSPDAGRRGAVELLLHASRRPDIATIAAQGAAGGRR